MQKNDFDVQIFVDGGSRGNPGPSGIGAVLFDGSGKRIKEVMKYIGNTTNNVAEYLAVIYALQEAISQKAKKVLLHVDSELVAKQIDGEYRVRDEKIRLFFDLTVDLFRLFDKVEIRQVPRTENKEADFLVNKAIDFKPSHSLKFAKDAH